MEVGGHREVRGFRFCCSTTSNVERAPKARAATTAPVCLYPALGQRKEGAMNAMFFIEEICKCFWNSWERLLQQRIEGIGHQCLLNRAEPISSNLVFRISTSVCSLSGKQPDIQDPPSVVHGGSVVQERGPGTEDPSASSHLIMVAVANASVAMRGTLRL